MSSADSVRPSQQRWRVIVIDDSPDDRDEVRRALASSAHRTYDVAEYETSAEGSRAVLSEAMGPPDCVVLDYHLPDADAPDVLRLLRDASGCTICPVVVITGKEQEDVGRAVLRAGAEDFIGKSWMTPQSLTRAIENARERWLLAREVSLSESRLRGLADAIPQPVWMRDARGRVAHVNQRWLDSFGPLRSESDDMWRQLLHPDDAEEVLRQHEVAAITGESYLLEARMHRRDGSYRWYQMSAAAIRDAAGEITHWCGVCTDVHEVRENDAWLRLALQASKTGIWTWDLSTDAVEWTPECYDIHGIAPGGFSGTGAAFFRTVHPDDRSAVEGAVRAAIASRSLYRTDFRIVQPDGAVKWVLNLGRASYDDVGTPLRMLGTITDISDRKLAEAALAERERELQRLADNTPDIIARFDQELRHVFVNAAVERATRLPASAFVGKTNQEVGMPPELCQRWDTALRAVFDTGQLGQLEFDMGAGPLRRSYASRLVPEVGADGRVAFVLCIVTDFTERKAAEDALRASEERLRRAQRAAHTGTWDWNVATGKATWTDEAWLLFGREPSREEVTFDLWLSCIHPEDRARAAEKVRQVLAAATDYRDEFRVLRPDGHTTLLEAIGEAVLDAAGGVVRLVGTVRDITEPRRAEVALQRAVEESRRAVNAREKLVSLVSHDLKNPLNALTLGIGLLERSATPDRQTLSRMKRQAGRMERIIDELLDVAQLHAGTPLQLQRRDTDLVSLVRTLVSEHQERSPKHVIGLSAAAEQIVGNWDGRRLERVVSNLLSNATKYSPNGGAVTVTVEIVGGSTDQVVLAVADQGMGIAPDEQARVFDWYARAEDVKRSSIQGSGIGLAGVRDIVLQHGGSIALESTLGRGTVFTVTLPMPPRFSAPEPRSSPRVVSETPRVSETRRPT